MSVPPGVGVEVEGVGVLVGVEVIFGVFVGTGVDVILDGLNIIGATHKARSPTGEPVANTVRINLISCPTRELKSRSA